MDVALREVYTTGHELAQEIHLTQMPKRDKNNCSEGTEVSENDGKSLQQNSN